MTGKDSKKGVNKSSSSGQAVQNGGQNTVVQSGQAVGQCQAFVQAQGQGQQGYIASLSQGNPIFFTIFQSRSTNYATSADSVHAKSNAEHKHD